MAVELTRWKPTFSLLSQVLLVVFTAQIALCSPMDPHLPQCGAGWLVPNDSFFEGWFTTMVDPANGRRISAIIAVTPCSNQTYVALLSCLPHVGRQGCVTQVSASLTKAYSLTVRGNPVSADPDSHQPPSFEWFSPDHGSYSVQRNLTTIHLHVGSVVLRAKLTKQVSWAADTWSWGPEGWLGDLSLLPVHLYVHSMASAVEYHFANASDISYWMGVFGSGWAEEEKAWGSVMPSGHVWGQAVSADNLTKVVFAVAEFNYSRLSPSAFISVVGYRSPVLVLDFRSTDTGVYMTEPVIDACGGDLRFSISTYSYELQLEARAPSVCFGPPLLGPRLGSAWTFTCEECLGAKVRLKLYSHTAWGFIGGKTLLEEHTLLNAALSFGGNLVCASGPGRARDGKLSRLVEGVAF